MFSNRSGRRNLIRSSSSDNINGRIKSALEDLEDSNCAEPITVTTNINLEEVRGSKDIKKLCELTPRSLALTVYKIYLDLGSETLEILKKEGLEPSHFLLDIGPRFLTCCYISSYLKRGRYYTVAETSTENDCLEICDTYVELATGENKRPDCSDTTLKDFCISDFLENVRFNFILIQRNLAAFEDKDLDILFFKITDLLKPSGKIMAHYVENFPDRPGGFPLLIFKRILGKLNEYCLSVRTLCYRPPMNLRMLCITKNKNRNLD